MASPQKEDGYTPIANEIMEALASHRIPGEQRQCLDFILRMSYGYHKKDCELKNKQFVKATNLKKSNVCRALNELVNKNFVIKNDNGVIKGDNKNNPTYRFNKNYEEWNFVIKNDNVIKSDNTCYQKREQHYNKDNLKITLCPRNEFSDDSIQIKLASYLLNWIIKNNPKAKKPNLQRWAHSFDLIIRIDKRNSDDIKRLIKWTQKDPFWMSNILSPDKLRKQYDQLWLKMSGGIKPVIEREHKAPG